MIEPIDFVVLWVDENDPEWRQELNKWQSEESRNGCTSNRFRDWKLLRYWFRGIERFAPWVNRVFFVTCGHVPEWLNTDHPKLRVVRHDEYIPSEFLPTFNSNVIELFLNRIPDLSEQFVLFSDDVYLTAPVSEKCFFKNGLPCEAALMDAPAPDDPHNEFPHMMLNNAAIINRHFRKREVLKKHLTKFFYPGYRMGLVRNMLLAPLKWFSCFRSEHTPMSHLKSTFDIVWEREGDLLIRTGTHRFRSRGDVTHWVMRDWRLCEGRFVPRGTGWARCFELGLNGTDTICRAIEGQQYQVICINDSFEKTEYMETQKRLHDSFEKLLPKQSSFER